MIPLLFGHVAYGFAFVSLGVSFGHWLGIKTGKIIAKRDHDTEKFLDDLKKFDEKWKKQISDFPHRNTWNCQICHTERADALIGVSKYSAANGSMIIHIKYCKDKSECADKAHSLSYWYGESVELIKDNK